MRNLRVVTLVALLAGGVISLHADSTFITGDVPLGTPTTFVDTNNGVSATFSSPAGPGGFVTASTFFSFVSEILYDPGPSGASGIPMNIAFSKPGSSVSMNFATDGPGTFNLNAYLGGTLVGTASAVGTVVISFPEGTISFSGAKFDSLVLTSPSTPYFAIGNIDFVPSSVPEPGSMFLMASGLGLLAGTVRRRLLP